MNFHFITFIFLGGGGGGYYGGSSGGLGGCSGGGGNGNNDGNDGNHNRRNINNNNNKGSILDIELDFEELPQAANNSNNTAKWFQEHQDINAGKILDGLLSLKTEFPDDSSNGSNPGSSSSMDKPPDMASLDHATANLLQMSVPDPSTTFLGKKNHTLFFIIFWVNTTAKLCLIILNVSFCLLQILELNLEVPASMKMINWISSIWNISFPPIST